MNKFYISGKLPSLNDYTKANRTNKYAGAKVKSDTEKRIRIAINQALKKGELHRPPQKVLPIKLRITWYEQKANRDLDNISFAVKFIQDALVDMEVLDDDSQKYINGLTHRVSIDKTNPRIEVELIERGEQDA